MVEPEATWVSWVRAVEWTGSATGFADAGCLLSVEVQCPCVGLEAGAASEGSATSCCLPSIAAFPAWATHRTSRAAAA